VLTFGLYVPQTVEWWCDDPQCAQPEVEEVWDPDAPEEEPPVNPDEDADGGEG
jgi:hypothetical protein